jgi:hypothetical protein
MSTINVDKVIDTSGGILAPISSVFRNRIINGAMVIDQRNAGAAINPAVNNGYSVDRWLTNSNVASKYSVQQNAGAVTPPSGFKNYLGVTSSSSYSITSSDVFSFQQVIEGFNVADLGWGAAGAQAVTLSFWVRSSLTGTFGGALQNTNSGANRSYPFTFAISAANTWEQKTITVAGDTSGTWGSTNGEGLTLKFGLGVGSTLSGTAGAWAASNFWSATGATSVVGTSGATFYLTGVQLEKGSTATPFEFRSIGQELGLAQRYYETVGWQQRGSGTSGSGAGFFTNFSVPKRAVPTIALSSVSYLYGLTAASAAVTIYQGGVEIFATSTGGAYAFAGTYNASSEL